MIAKEVTQNFGFVVIETRNISFNSRYAESNKYIKTTLPITAIKGLVHPHKKQMMGTIIKSKLMNTII